MAQDNQQRRRVDWDAVERDYRTDTLTLRELADKHGVAHTTISRRAEREGWQKDLTEAIRQATNTRLINETVQQKCTTAHQNATDTVLVAAEVNTQVILRHRTGLSRLTAIKEKLLGQIEQAAEQMPDLAEVIEMVRQPDDNGIDRANDAMRKAMGRGALVDDLKKLTEVDERIRKGEREAFGLDDEGAKKSESYEDMLRSIVEGR
ncbi:MAG: hypothetical protein ACMV1D_05020 [Macromonas sp.]